MICASRRKARNSFGVQRQEIAALEADAARIRLDQPQHQPADGGFAAAGFADQRQRLAGIDAEADAVDRLDEGGRPPNTDVGDEMLTRFSTSSRRSSARTEEQWFLRRRTGASDASHAGRATPRAVEARPIDAITTPAFPAAP